MKKCPGTIAKGGCEGKGRPVPGYVHCAKCQRANEASAKAEERAAARKAELLVKKAKDAIQHIAVEPTRGGYRVRAQHGENSVTRGGFASSKKAEKFGRQMMQKMGEQAAAPARYGLGWKIRQQNLQEPPEVGGTVYFAHPMTGVTTSGKMLGVGGKSYLFNVESDGKVLTVPCLALRSKPANDAAARRRAHRALDCVLRAKGSVSFHT